VFSDNYTLSQKLTNGISYCTSLYMYKSKKRSYLANSFHFCTNKSYRLSTTNTTINTHNFGEKKHSLTDTFHCASTFPLRQNWKCNFSIVLLYIYFPPRILYDDTHFSVYTISFFKKSVNVFLFL